MNCSKTRGKKGEEHFDPTDPPRCRANKRRGRGTYANDRPPVLGTIGRQSGKIRLRVVTDTKKSTLTTHVHQFTMPYAFVCTDEYESYQGIDRPHATIAHGRREWARDDDRDGIREVHSNTIEGLWTGLRAFLAPFRGVHKQYLAGYVAIYEWKVNRKRIDPPLISALVSFHSLRT